MCRFNKYLLYVNEQSPLDKSLTHRRRYEIISFWWVLVYCSMVIFLIYVYFIPSWFDKEKLNRGVGGEKKTFYCRRVERLLRGLLLAGKVSHVILHCSYRGIDGLLLSPHSWSSPAMICFLQETRLKEGIVRLQPQEEPLRSELLSGKFTVLVSAHTFGIPYMEISSLMSYCREGCY